MFLSHGFVKALLFPTWRPAFLSVRLTACSLTLWQVTLMNKPVHPQDACGIPMSGSFEKLPELVPLRLPCPRAPWSRQRRAIRADSHDLKGPAASHTASAARAKRRRLPRAISQQLHTPAHRAHPAHLAIASAWQFTVVQAFAMSCNACPMAVNHAPFRAQRPSAVA